MAALPSFWVTIAIATIFAIIAFVTMGLFGSKNRFQVEGKVHRSPKRCTRLELLLTTLDYRLSL
jgi:hypothetical protein